MIIGSAYQAYLTENGLFLYDQLPSDIQLLAIKNMQKVQRDYYDSVLSIARNKIKEDVHWCINCQSFLQHIVEQSRLFKLMQDQEYCIKYMLDFSCEFKADGSLYRVLPW